MKNLNYVILASLLITACGKATTSDGSGTTTVNTTIVSDTVLESSGKTIAYIMSFQGQDNITVYIPASGKYAEIALSTGNYAQTQSYFSGTNCTGTVMASSWVGEVGDAVIYSNSTYYLITGTTTTQFTYQSYWNTLTGACVNSSSITTAGLELGTVSMTTQPYSFTGSAPWTPVYNQ